MAGMTTAARAAELGLNVLVLEQTGSVGGSAMVAGGTLLGCGTNDASKRPASRIAPSCASRTLSVWAARAPSTRKSPVSSPRSAAKPWTGWTISGADFGDREPYFGVYQPLNAARNYSGNGGASAFITALSNELDNHIGKNAYIALNTRVEGLLTDENGAVVGAKATAADGSEVEYHALADRHLHRRLRRI